MGFPIAPNGTWADIRSKPRIIEVVFVGGEPLLIDDKQSFLRRVANKYYLTIQFDSVRAEMHGDSEGSVYVTENRGKRIQRFTIVR